jgi:hypothetical protein
MGDKEKDPPELTKESFERLLRKMFQPIPQSHRKEVDET